MRKNNQYGLPSPIEQHDAEVGKVDITVGVDVGVRIAGTPERKEYREVDQIYFAIVVEVGSI